MAANKKKNKNELVYKPMCPGKPFNRIVLKRGAKLLTYQLIFAVFYLLMGVAMSSTAFVIRAAVAASVLLVCCALIWFEGAKHGENDVTTAQIVYARKEEGKTVNTETLDQCYHPARGVIVFLLAILPLVIITGVYALIAQREVISLPIPEWVTDDISTGRDPALAYYTESYQNEINPTGIRQVLRVIVRTCIFPFMSLTDSLDKSARLLVDRLSPLLIIIPFIAYIPGYMLSTRARARIQGTIAASDRKEQRRRAKMEQRRQERDRKNRLI